MYYISSIPVHVLAEDVLLVAGSAILISFLATVYPANQAAKLEPVAALRMNRFVGLSIEGRGLSRTSHRNIRASVILLTTHH